jgi:hypothetical protein
MWNQLRSFIIWLHAPDHVAKFQRYFGVLPLSNHKPDLIPKTDEKSLNKNNNSSNNTINGNYHRHHERKITYDTNVLDECIEEIKHSSNSNVIDYQITSWIWYYFFQFGAALGNEIFYILFFPTW